MDGLDDLERWAADARAREAAGARVRERWLRAQAEEGANLAGLLLGLAERREAVLVTTAPGGRHRGVVTGVGVDFVALEAPGGAITLVALGALATVKVVADEGRATGGRAAAGGRPGRGRGGAVTGGAATGDGSGLDRLTFGVRLVDVLGQAAGQRPRISVQAGATSVVGDLRAMGDDVLTLRGDGAAGLVYVSLASVSEVSVLASG
jgi:hypothetical protein